MPGIFMARSGAIGASIARVVELIRRAAPDIVALQEVDSRRAKNGEDTFGFLQDALGSHGIGAKSVVTQDGAYGQMLISRWPMRDTEIHDISYGEFEPRRAIGNCIETALGPLRVVATHLGLSIRERRSQAKELLAMAGEPAGTVVVMEDFNDWFWPGSVRSVLRAELPGRSRYRTFPSLWPMFRLDRIYCRLREALLRAWSDRAARHLSDHLPVIGDVKL